MTACNSYDAIAFILLKGLFSSAGLESGAFYDGVQTATVASQKDGWDKIVRDLGCSAAKSIADCVAAAPTDSLVKANLNSGEFAWSITVDGVDLTAPGPVLVRKHRLSAAASEPPPSPHTYTRARARINN